MRLELLVGALFGNTPPVVASEPPALPSFARRLALRIPRHLITTEAQASTDGVRIGLPRNITASRGLDAAVATYRIMAIEQAARVARGSAELFDPALPPDVRDLYQLSEAVAVDMDLATSLPGLIPELVTARRAALDSRPALRLLTERERVVEELLRTVLVNHPASAPDALPVAASPHESMAWARRTATDTGRLPGRYRGLPPVLLWGMLKQLPDAPVPGRRPLNEEHEPRADEKRVATMRRRPLVRQKAEDEDDSHMGLSMIQLDDPQEHVEDPMGLKRPADTDYEADPDDLADSLSELPEARLVTAPGKPTEVLASDDPPPRQPLLADGVPRPGAYAYPEWDYRISAYLPAHAVVREVSVQRGDPNWVQHVLRKHAAEVEQVRRRFEKLRPRRVRLGRQLEGADVDIAAFTVAFADARAGGRSEDRLYESVRPERRDIAVSLLVDVSGSTDSWLSDNRRIIDVEKEAVLLVCEALDALGDRYSVTAFSGEGPESVALYPVKRFDERYGQDVRLRIAALEHDRYTRLGAAVRHVTAQLARESARHRLLLVLTDGKPNDVDLYEGRYGIEDARQAVAEARLQSLHPFCLTVDREAPAYLARMFGAGSYAVLRRAETLPLALVEVLRRLLAD